MQPFDKISTVTIAVRDQDEALTWFTQMLGFEKRIDQCLDQRLGKRLDQSPDKRGQRLRWLTVAPPQQAEVEFLLASWFPDLIGKNPTWVISTRDCQGGYEELKSKGIEFKQSPMLRPWGIEAVFVDLYGNKYALVQESAQVLTSEAESKALGVPALAGALGKVTPAR
jgi:hypothetical protein